MARRAEASAALDAQATAERQLAAALERHAGLESMRGGAEAHARRSGLPRKPRSCAEEAELVLSRAKAEGAHVEERREAARRALDAARSRLAGAETRRLVAEGDALAAIVHGLQGRVGGTSGASNWQHHAAARPGRRADRGARGRGALPRDRACESAVAVARAADELEAAEHEVVACEAAVAEHADAFETSATTTSSSSTRPRRSGPSARSSGWNAGSRARRRQRAGARAARGAERSRATIAAQHDDLARAGADLRTMARHLEREIEQRFDTVFGAVSFHFQELYAELFPGGKATLRLEEPEPPVLDLDGVGPPRAERRPGVEILAQPPGKRQTPLRLLSGGERALTALAVVLALQQVNPSPFYVFDEVDAALDDSNVFQLTACSADSANPSSSWWPPTTTSPWPRRSLWARHRCGPHQLVSAASMRRRWPVRRQRHCAGWPV